jgi:hypothetical protein
MIAYSKEYRDKNVEKLRASKKEYYNINKEKDKNII